MGLALQWRYGEKTHGVIFHNALQRKEMGQQFHIFDWWQAYIWHQIWAMFRITFKIASWEHHPALSTDYKKASTDKACWGKEQFKIAFANSTIAANFAWSKALIRSKPVMEWLKKDSWILFQTLLKEEDEPSILGTCFSQWTCVQDKPCQ